MAKEQDEDITTAISESSGRKLLLRFSDDDRNKLKFTFQLPDQLIDQIEQRIGKQKGWVDHCLNIPTAKRQRRTIVSLHKSVCGLIDKLNKLHSMTEQHMAFAGADFSKNRVLKELELMKNELAKVSLPKSKTRKKPTHLSLEETVVNVAQLMIESNIIPIKRNKQFEGIISIVFKTMAIKASPQVVIDKCWHYIEAYITSGEDLFIDRSD